MVNKVKIQIYCSFLLLFFCSSHLFAIGMETAIKKAREAESEGVIVCSPDGKNGELPALAVAKLKEGMELRLMPGRYPAEIIIDCNKVIISSEGTEPCYVDLRVRSRSVIVRGINIIGDLSIYRDSIIIDSLINYLKLVGFSKEKTDLFVYNTGFNYVRSYSSNPINLTMKNCTVKSYFYLRASTRVSIEDSILYSPSILFRVYDYSNKKGRLFLKNNLLYAGSLLANDETSSSSKKTKLSAALLKDLKKVWGAVLVGDNMVAKPAFMEKSYFLTDESIGHGKGLIPDEHPKYKKPKVAEKEVSVRKPVPVTAKKVSPPKVRPRIPTPHKKLTPPPSKPLGGGLGGIPTPP